MSMSIESAAKSLRASVMPKVLFMSLLVVLLLIPVEMIESLIEERQHRRNSAVNDVQNRWGGDQVIGGAVLSVPYMEKAIKNRDTTYSREHAQFLPESLRVEGTVDTQIRYRGIFEVLLYSADLRISGQFRQPDFESLGIDSSRINWEGAVLNVGISDTRGVKETLTLAWNKEELPLEPGTPHTALFGSGLHVPVDIVPDSATPGVYGFRLKLRLNGSENLAFLPLGKETMVDISSPWPNPSFNGEFLPEHRSISTNGFESNWRVSYLGRSFPQQWSDRQVRSTAVFNSAFGVGFLIPVDSYQKSMRASKYAILFVLLTFVVFFMFEILNKLRIHPIQYLLIGVSVCLFYLLILSLSEHLSFDLSYFLATLGTVLTITGYSLSILEHRKRAIIIFMANCALYGILYTLLQLEDFSLLVGTGSLFVAIALIMFLTRNIDWYAIKRSGTNSSERVDKGDSNGDELNDSALPTA